MEIPSTACGTDFYFSISQGLREISFLTTHGILHLLGYDHMNPEDEEKMFSLQKELLNNYGIKK